MKQIIFNYKKLLFGILLLFPLQLFSQSKTISGLVTDVQGEPLIGVSVMVQNSKSGTVTNNDGNFILNNVPEKTVLVFSYIGYETKTIKTDGNTHINVVLNETSQILDEMVVVGYGAQKKLSITGSVASVSSKELERTSAPTLASALAGKVDGITFRQVNGQPGQTMRMEIRNMGTPLYVIDGIMKDEGQFNNLDVNDIESISIIKDGASAVYGVKAANGVVLVTTKRGKLNEKPVVTVNTYYGIQNWTTFPKLSNAYDYTRAWTEAELNTKGINSKNLTWNELQKWKIGYYNLENGEDYRGFDWYDFSLRANAPQKYLNISSSGGSEKTNYYLSISRIVQDASFYDFQFNRSNFQMNIDSKISKSLKVGVSMNGRIETRLSPTIGSSYSDDYWRMRWGLNQNRPTERPYANDNPTYLNKTYNILTNEAYGRRDIAGTRDDIWRVFQGNWDAEWALPIKGLSLKALYSYYLANEQEDAEKNQVYFYTYDKTNNAYITSDANSTGSASLGKRQRTIWENMYRFSINYDSKIRDNSLSVILAAEADERFDKNIHLSNASLTNNFQSLFGSSDENNIIDTDTYSEIPTCGFVGKLNYDYKGKYLFEFAGRYDGSFKFPVGHRWGFFPTISGGWRISEESFFRKRDFLNFITNLKLRASYGEMGDDNVGIGNFDYMSGYNYQTNSALIAEDPFGSNSASTVQTAILRGLPVTNVSWIHVTMRNVGLDLGVLNNKLNFEANGFYRKRTGLTTTRADITIPLETGYSMPLENLNSDMWIGSDGSIKWNSNIGKVNYYIGVNTTFSRKKDGSTYGQKFSDSWNKYRTSTNNRWSYINWGYQVIGRFQTQEEIDNYPVIMCLSNGSDRNMKVLPGDPIYKDQNGDGIINDYDSRPIGYAEGGLPYLTYGINMGVMWKELDFSIDFAGASFQSFQQNYETKWPFQASGNTFEFMVNDRWHHSDPLDPSSPWVAGYYPALRLTPTDSWNVYCNNSEYWLTNVRYLRLRNMEIGYTVPKKLTNKISISACRLYFNGTNLLTFSNLSKIGLDPENNDTNGLGYPNNKVMTLGVNVTF